MLGVAPEGPPYAGSRSARRPSTVIRTIGPWWGADSRAKRHPVNAAPATARMNSVMMTIACQRFRAGGAYLATYFLISLRCAAASAAAAVFGFAEITSSNDLAAASALPAAM